MLRANSVELDPRLQKREDSAEKANSLRTWRKSLQSGSQNSDGTWFSKLKELHSREDLVHMRWHDADGPQCK